MLQSVPKVLKCFTCGSKPNQFIILACDHVICQKCIAQNTLQQSHKEIFIKCKCGVISLFIDGMIQQITSQEILLKLNQNSYHTKLQQNKVHQKQIVNDIRPQSLTINQKNQNTSFENIYHNTTCQTKEIQSRISYPHEDVHYPHNDSFNEKSKRNWMSRKTHHQTRNDKNNTQFRLKTCHANYQQGSPFFQNEQNSDLENVSIDKKLKKSRKSSSKRKPGQLHFYEVDNESRISKETKLTTSHEKNKMLSKQIEFVKLMHQKSISDLRQAFEHNIKILNKQFQEVILDFKDMITEDLFGVRQQMDWLKYGKILKKIYNKRLCKKIQSMMHMLQKSEKVPFKQDQKIKNYAYCENIVEINNLNGLSLEKDRKSKHNRSSGKLCQYHQYKTKTSYNKFLQDMVSNKRLCKKSDPTKIYKFQRIL